MPSVALAHRRHESATGRDHNPALPAGGWLAQTYAELRDKALVEATKLEHACGADANDTLTDLLLYVCAAEQVAADHLVEGGLSLAPLRGMRHVPQFPLSVVEAAAARACDLRAATSRKRTRAILSSLRRLALDLATPLAGGALADVPSAVEVADRFPLPESEGLAARTAKIPACFRGQDLGVEDCFELATRFAETAGRALRVLVTGVRTSGSYMAPLCAGWLRAHGFEADYTTLRPKAPHVWSERSAIREACPDAVLIVDDPPMTGSAFVMTALRLERCGIPRSRITFLVPLSPENALDSDARARGFDRYYRVELPAAETAVRRRLGGEEIREWLRTVTGSPGAPVISVWDAKEVDRQAQRRHVKQLFEVGGYGRVLVKGVGAAWFADPAVVAASALRGRTVSVLGFWKGLMAMRWERGEGAPRAEARPLAGYVAARAVGLAIPTRAPAPRMRKDAYYRLAKVLARVYGPFAPARIESVRQLLVVAAGTAPSCVVDGRMDRENWLQSPHGLLKCDFEEHAFDKDDLEIFDPAYDLAGALLEFGPSRMLQARLLETYSARVRDGEVASRLPLASLLYGAGAFERAGWDVRGELGTESWPAAVQRWLGAESALTWSIAALLADGIVPRRRSPPTAGVLWALDVDGVLEDAGLGFPAITPAAATAIALIREAGALAVLNTGRSLDEVRVRCDALGLDGGVAEYGGAVWDNRRRRSHVLLGDQDTAALAAVREAARTLPHVHVDARYEHSIRLREYSRGRLRRLDPALVEKLLANGGDRLAAVPGAGQTDIVAISCDKGRGLRELIRVLEFEGRCVAIGDAAADLPAFAVAHRAFAPRHHDEALRGVATILRQDRQQAVLRAVELVHGVNRRRVRTDPSGSLAAIVRLLALHDRPRWWRAARSINPGVLGAFRT